MDHDFIYTPKGCSADGVPHSDATGQDALNCASDLGSGSSQFAEDVETLLCFLGRWCSVDSAGVVFCNVHTLELGTGLNCALVCSYG